MASLETGASPTGPKPAGPRPPIDVTGPRLPRLLQNVVAARCFNCSTALSPDLDWKGKCPKCAAALHCCKQCAHFEPSTRFQCLKPVPVRIAGKDQPNDCELFKPRVTVARDAAPSAIITTLPRLSSNKRRALLPTLAQRSTVSSRNPSNSSSANDVAREVENCHLRCRRGHLERGVLENAWFGLSPGSDFVAQRIALSIL